MKKQKVDEREISICFHKYYEGLYRYAYTIIKNNEHAKDIVQQVFLQILEKKEKIEIDYSLKAYLFKSVYNLSINHIKRHTDNIKIEDSSLHIKAAEPFYKIEEIELRKKVYDAVNMLPPQCKVVFLKQREESLTYAQIASELNISVKTVEAHMSKALKIIREELNDYFFFLLTLFLILNFI